MAGAWRLDQPKEIHRVSMDTLFCPECQNLLDLPGDEETIICSVCGAAQSSRGTEPRHLCNQARSIRKYSCGDKKSTWSIWGHISKKGSLRSKRQDTGRGSDDKGKVSQVWQSRDDLSHDAASLRGRGTDRVLRLSQVSL